MPYTRGILWWTCAAAVLCGACDSPATAPSPVETQTPVRRVVVLGDSLAVSPSPGESFPAQLQARVTRQGLPWTVTNAAISGDTSADGLRRLDSVLGADVGVLVLELGANDGLDGVEISTIRNNLSAIITSTQARGIRVLLCGMETPPTRGFGYSLAFHSLFPDLARRHAVPLVPFLLAGVALVPALNGPDGVHPNAAGALRIAETVWPYLEPLLAPASTINWRGVEAAATAADHRFIADAAAAWRAGNRRSAHRRLPLGAAAVRPV
jgi:acyl-CoA thioesterase-1